MKFSFDDLAPVLRQFEGPLTAELVRRPGEFGLGQIPSKTAPDATTTMVCGFCSTGCGLKIHLRDGSAVNLSPDTEYPVNLGMACPKGWEALTPLDAPDRGTTPLIAGKSASWHQAMTLFSSKLRDIQQRHGADSVAVLSTGQIVTEEMCFLGALARLGLGIPNIDSNTRQCMATSHVAYKQSFGFDAPPFSYSDFEQSDVLVFIGANPCIAHPIMWQRVLRNRRSPEILVVDPRKTETAMAATRHFAIAPKSDLTLLYGLANIVISSGWIDREFIARSVSGYAEFAEFVREFTTDRVCAATGLEPEALWQFAELVGDKTKRVSWWWTMGVNQSHESTRTAQAIIALALITGQIGKPGTGANSITGQCNAMGSRLFAHASGLPCNRDFLSEADRGEVAGIYGMPVDCVPKVNSLAYDQIITGVKEGKIKALWVIATNSAHSWGSSEELREALAGLELLVVQDMYPTTETAQMAHIYFPAAGWGEKDGTFINSERRFGLAKKVRRAPGEAMSDFNILRLVAEYCGVAEQFREWSSPEAVFRIMQRLSQGRPCDITGIAGYSQLDADGGIQWPYPMDDKPEPTAKERRLFGDGRFFHADEKARILFEAPRPPSEPTDSEYPFVLLTGRGSSAQWHTGSRTAKSAILVKMHSARTCVEIHPEDAQVLGIENGGAVEVRSRRGVATVYALVTSTVLPGNVFIAMHDAQVNHLTAPECDKYSRQPSYKFCAVQITRV
jgi:predicted molibdopterin-dependent oxidoreductase YjgC